MRHDNAAKRGGGAVRGESALVAPGGDGEPGLLQVMGREPSPEFACRVAEEFRHLLDELGDDELRQVALWKMEGYTNAEIAGKLGYVEKTVERKLKVIRTIWGKGRG